MEEVTDVLAAIMLSVHLQGTHTAATAAPNALSNMKLKKVRCLTISAVGSSKDWSYFVTSWADYVAVTSVTGKDKVIQLLECCDEQLRKDLT